MWFPSLAATDAQSDAFVLKLEPVLSAFCASAAVKYDAKAVSVDMPRLVTALLSGFMEADPLAHVSSALDHVLQEVEQLRVLVEHFLGSSSDVLGPLGRLLDRHFSGLPARITGPETSMQQLTATFTILLDR